MDNYSNINCNMQTGANTLTQSSVSAH